MKNYLLVGGILGGAVLVLLAPQQGHAKTIKFKVNTANDTVDADVGDGICADAAGDCSLRAAIMEANAAGERVIIQLQKNATYGLTLTGAGEDAAATGDLDVTGIVEITGKNVTIELASADRGFDVQAAGSLKLKGLTISNGLVTDQSGGAIRSAGTLVVDSCTLSGNQASGVGASGGGIFNDGGTLTVTKTTFTGGMATRAGGGIEANGGETTVSKSTFTLNEAGPTPGNGGGIHITGDGNIDVSKSEFTMNTAAREGGGLWNSTGTMTISKTTIDGNRADGPASDDGGGGIFNNGGTLEITKGTISNNRAEITAGSGGGIFNNGGTLNVTGTTISGNFANRAGGGIESLTGTNVLVKVKLQENETGASPGNGGGLHLTGEGLVNVEKSDVSGNTAAAEGGGLWNSSTGTMTVVKTKFRGNTASGNDSDQGGGGIFNEAGLLNVGGCTFDRNIADGTSGSGGGILNNDGGVDVTKSKFTNNEAQRAGGGIETNSGVVAGEALKFTGNMAGPNPGNGGGLHVSGDATVTLEKVQFIKNTASNEGGGLWNSGTGTINVLKGKAKKNSAPTGQDLFNLGGTFIFNDEPVAPPIM